MRGSAVGQCRQSRVLSLLLLSLLVASRTLQAHTGHGDGGGGLGYGFLHPLTGVDHVIAMVAVGLWGAQLGGVLIWLLPVVFPLMMAGGAVLGVRGIALPAPEFFIALSGVALGVAVLSAWRATRWAALILVGVFAVFHGHAHGSELPSAASPLAFGVGFVVGTGLLHLCGILIGLVKDWQPFGGLLIRASGAVIALIGCYFAYQAVAV